MCLNNQWPMKKFWFILSNPLQLDLPRDYDFLSWSLFQTQVLSNFKITLFRFSYRPSLWGLPASQICLYGLVCSFHFSLFTSHWVSVRVPILPMGLDYFMHSLKIELLGSEWTEHLPCTGLTWIQSPISHVESWEPLGVLPESWAWSNHQV